MNENMEMTSRKANNARKHEILAFTVLPFFISLMGLGFIVAWSFVSANTKVQTGFGMFTYIAGIVFLSLLFLVGAYIACWFLTNKKKQSPLYLLVAVLYLSTSVCLYVGLNSKVKSEKNANKATVDEIALRIQDDMEGTQIEPGAFDKDKFKDTQEAIVLFENYLVDLKALKNQLEQKIQEEQLGNILSVKTLESYQKILEARKTIQTMTGVVDEQKVKLKKLHEDYLKDIKELTLPTIFKKELITSFENMMADVIEDYNNFYEIDKKILTSSDSVLKYLEDRKDKYFFEGEDISFINNFENATQYGILTSDVQQNIKQEEDYIKTMKDNAEKRSEEFKNQFE